MFCWNDCNCFHFKCGQVTLVTIIMISYDDSTNCTAFCSVGTKNTQNSWIFFSYIECSRSLPEPCGVDKLILLKQTVQWALLLFFKEKRFSLFCFLENPIATPRSWADGGMERYLIPGSIFMETICCHPLRIEARRCEDELCLVKVHVTVAMLLFVKCEQKNELTVI